MKIYYFVYFILYIIQSIADEDYYAILGVDKEATPSEIKKAYRRLSLKLHPDKNKGDKETETKFAAVANAYEVLSDKEKRRIYDQFGEDGLKNMGNGEEETHNPFDIFEQFFGGGGRRRQQQQRRRGPPKSPELILPIYVSLSDLYMGKAFSFSIRRQVTCTNCKGSGAQNANDIKNCPACGGHGIKVTTQRTNMGYMQFQSTCDKCNGKGKIHTSTCKVCGGKKTIFADEEVNLEIEPGMSEASDILMEEVGDTISGHLPGDLRFMLKQLPHPIFSREGDDLWMELTLTLREALLGFTREIIHLDGHNVKISTTEVTKPHEVIVLKEEGMPKLYSSEKGDLHVKIQVEFPKILTKEQREGFQEFFRV